MKTFFTTLLVIIYLAVSMGVLMVAMVYPFALSLDDGPPAWTCWILYPVALVVMASQSQVLDWIDTLRREREAKRLNNETP